MKRGFTMIELLLAVVLLGIVSTFGFMTFRTVSHGWQVSTDYVDRLEHTDYAIDQLVSALKCAYYPHNGSTDGDFGFMLTDNGDGDSPRRSDVIEWSKLGTAIIGSRSSVADSVHRIQLMVLEEGDRDWNETIEKTGLYARVKPNAKAIPKTSGIAADSLGFDNEELYQPVLVADGVVGFDCKVLKEKPESGQQTQKGNVDVSKFEDEYAESNSVPYKVQLTMYVEKEDADFLSRKQRVPVIRIVELPIHDQSKDGSALPGGEKDGPGGKGGKGGSK